LKKVFVARDRVWAELETRRTKGSPESLPRDWANEFFRPRPSGVVSEAERAARAEARDAARKERQALALKRKELSDKLRDTKKELASLGKKNRKG
jgi:hypothetical protein